MRSLGVIGASFSMGQKKSGVERGADCIRNSAGFQSFKGTFDHFADYGNVYSDFPFPVLWNSKKGALRFMKQLQEKAVQSLEENDFSLVLGGDHSISMASISAVKKLHPDCIVVWVDAHADINTYMSSVTKSLHGMPVAALLGLSERDAPDSWKELVREFHSLDLRDLIYVGVRDLDPAEKLHAKTSFLLSGEDLQHHAWEQSLGSYLDRLDPFRQRPIYISFDVDAMDPLWIQSTGTPVEAGINPKKLVQLLKLLKKDRQVVGADLVEFNPLLAADSYQLEKNLSVVAQFLMELSMFTSTETYEDSMSLYYSGKKIFKKFFDMPIS